MFKLVVLSALLALAAAKPSHLAAYVAAPAVHAAYIAPAAVSHQSRVDVHHSVPLAYSAWAAPAAAYHGAWAAPVAPLAPLAAYHGAWAAPLALAPKTPAVVLGPHGVPLDTAAVVADRAYHYQVKANQHLIHKRSVLAAAPLAYVAAAPAAVSHQSRVDVIKSAPVVAAYAPVLSHYAAAPAVLSHYAAAPVLSHYAAPWSTRSYWGKAAAYGVHPW